MIRTPQRTTRIYDFPAYRPPGRQAVAAWKHAGIFFLSGERMDGKKTAPKFFIPFAETSEKAEGVYSAIKKHAKEFYGWPIKERRIYRIDFENDGVKYTAVVGEPTAFNGEMVFTILQSTTYLVCTENRGALSGSPIMVGHTSSVEDFSN